MHDRNEICIMEIDALKKRADGVESRLSVLSDISRDVRQSQAEVLDRMDKKHRKIDAMETTLNDLNVTLKSFMAVAETERKSVDQFRKSVDEITATLIELRAVVSEHNNFIHDMKQSKKEIIVLFAAPAAALLVTVMFNLLKHQ